MSALSGTGALRGPVILLVATVVVVAATAFQSYTVVDRELTASALARRASVSQLSGATQSGKFDQPKSESPFPIRRKGPWRAN
jgi:hypothetical protein